jgi:hypothetical protein
MIVAVREYVCVRLSTLFGWKYPRLAGGTIRTCGTETAYPKSLRGISLTSQVNIVRDQGWRRMINLAIGIAPSLFIFLTNSLL